MATSICGKTEQEIPDETKISSEAIARGAAIRAAREELGLTQKELSVAIGAKSAQRIGAIERGETKHGAYYDRLNQYLQTQLERKRLRLTRTSVKTTPSSNSPRFGQMKGPHNLPLYVPRAIARGAMAVPSKPLSLIERPQFLPEGDGPYALTMVGTSMMPRIEPGETIFVRVDSDPVAGRDHVFRTPDGAIAIVGRLLEFDDQNWRVRQQEHAAEEIISRKEYPICHLIEGVRHRFPT